MCFSTPSFVSLIPSLLLSYIIVIIVNLYPSSFFFFFLVCFARLSLLGYAADIRLFVRSEACAFESVRQ